MCIDAVKLGNMTCVLICVYHPNSLIVLLKLSPGILDIPGDDLSVTINELETFMYTFNDVFFVLGDDLNTDFSRDNAQTKYVKEF